MVCGFATLAVTRRLAGETLMTGVGSGWAIAATPLNSTSSVVPRIGTFILLCRLERCKGFGGFPFVVTRGDADLVPSFKLDRLQPKNRPSFK